MSKQDGSGKRFNTGKLRYDLVPPNTIKELAKVLTKGSEKYGERNWENGMKWSVVIASLKRHLSKIEECEDYDDESGLLHISHVLANAMFLSEYYNIYPQGDDRSHSYLKNKKRYGYDIDDVLGDFIGHYSKYNNIPEPSHWNFYLNGDKYDVSTLSKEFWLSMPVKTDPKKIKNEPVCYITHRTCPVEWTIEWLEKNGFPHAPVYLVNPETSKLDIAKKMELDFFVDDKYDTFQDFNSNGLFCWLFDAPHNKKYEVGFKRIYGLDNI